MNGKQQVSEAPIDRDSELRFHPEGPRVLIEVEALDDTAVSQPPRGGETQQGDPSPKRTA